MCLCLGYEPFESFFSDAFGLFWGFWLDFLKNGQNQQIWANFGVLRRGVGAPSSSIGPRYNMAKEGGGQASGTSRHSKATPTQRPTPWHRFTGMCFRHDLLVRYFKDLSIGLMGTL